MSTTLSKIIGEKKTHDMVSQDGSITHILPKRCRNNGILEEWNTGSFSIGQYPNIPVLKVYSVCSCSLSKAA
jgi:hypothetical protein